MSGYMPRNGITGSYGNFIFSFLQNLHAVFCSECTHLHYQGQECFEMLSYTPAIINLKGFWSSHGGTGETNPTRNHEVADLIPGLAQCVKDLVLP